MTRHEYDSELAPEARCKLERYQLDARIELLRSAIDRLKYLKIELRELLKDLALPDDEFLAQLDARRKERSAA